MGIHNKIDSPNSHCYSCRVAVCMPGAIFTVHIHENVIKFIVWVCHILLSHSNIIVSDSVVSFLLHVLLRHHHFLSVCFLSCEIRVVLVCCQCIGVFAQMCIEPKEAAAAAAHNRFLLLFCAALFWCDNRLAVLSVWSSKKDSYTPCCDFILRCKTK